MTAVKTKRGGHGGFNDPQHRCPLPLDHPKRCMFDPSLSRARWANHVERLERGPCRKYRMRGSKYCNKHAHSTEKARRRGSQQSVVPIYQLPMFYSTKLTGTLKQLVELQLQRPASEQISLVEELALMRSEALRAVELYNIALENGADKHTMESAAALMIAMLREVEKICVSAAKVRAQELGALSGLDMLDVINQTVRLIYDTVPDQYAKQLEQRMRDEIRLRNSVQGTNIAPHEVDSAVLAMDDTVPNV